MTSTVNPVKFAKDVMAALGIPGGESGKCVMSMTIEISKNPPLVTVVYMATDDVREPLCEVLKQYGLHDLGEVSPESADRSLANKTEAELHTIIARFEGQRGLK